MIRTIGEIDESNAGRRQFAAGTGLLDFAQNERRTAKPACKSMCLLSISQQRYVLSTLRFAYSTVGGRSRYPQLLGDFDLRRHVKPSRLGWFMCVDASIAWCSDCGRRLYMPSSYVARSQPCDRILTNPPDRQTRAIDKGFC